MVSWPIFALAWRPGVLPQKFGATGLDMRGSDKGKKNEVGDVVQLVRTLPCHGRGREFESRRPRHSFQRVTGRDTGNSNPQSNPHLLHRYIHSHGRQEFTLRRPCLVAVFLRVQIEGRLNLAVTQESLHGLRFDFRLVHQPVA